MNSLEQIYDRSVFDWHLPFEKDYEAMAAILVRQFVFHTVIDLGCGNGFMLKHLLLKWHKRVTAVDGSAVFLDYLAPELKPFARVADLAQPLNAGQHHLVISTEVAEHLPAAAADAFVENLARHCEHYLVFTAATPGQGGHDHLNEQPMSYWCEKIKRHGLELNSATTEALRTAFSLVIRDVSYITKNLAVFTRP